MRATVLSFNAETRQSSRRQTEIAASRKQYRAAEHAKERAEARRLSRALGVTEKALRASEGLNYHGPAMIAIERGYKVSAAKGRKAVFAVICQYYEDGYQSGTDDGARVEHQAVRG